MSAEFNSKIRQLHETPGISINVLWVTNRSLDAEEMVQFTATANASVMVKRDLREAFLSWQTGEYQALIVDHELGDGINGFDFIEAIKDTKFKPVTTFVIAATMDERGIRKYEKLGIDYNKHVWNIQMRLDELGISFRQAFNQDLLTYILH